MCEPFPPRVAEARAPIKLEYPETRGTRGREWAPEINRGGTKDARTPRAPTERIFTCSDVAGNRRETCGRLPRRNRDARRTAERAYAPAAGFEYPGGPAEEREVPAEVVVLGGGREASAAN